jgi:hypothetical protein
MDSFDEFFKAEGNRPATLEDFREIGRKNGLEVAGLFAKHCIGPDRSKLMPVQEWRRIFETDMLPKNLATMRAGGWTEEQIAVYLPALHGELDAMLLSYAEYGLISRPTEGHRI